MTMGTLDFANFFLLNSQTSQWMSFLVLRLVVHVKKQVAISARETSNKSETNREVELRQHPYKYRTKCIHIGLTPPFSPFYSLGKQISNNYRDSARFGLASVKITFLEVGRYFIR